MGVTSTVQDSSEQRQLFEVNDQVNVVLAKVEENNFMYKEEEIEKWRWHFTVLDEGVWQNETITGDTSTNFIAHPECKAYNWATAIAGHPFPVGYDFDSEELIGMRCRILIGHKPSKKSDMVFMTATAVMAPRAITAPIAAVPEDQKF